MASPITRSRGASGLLLLLLVCLLHLGVCRIVTYHDDYEFRDGDHVLIKGRVVLAHSIHIPKSAVVTISGENDSSVLDCHGNRCFFVNSDSRLELRNLVVKGGDAKQYQGGAVFLDRWASLKAHKVNFVQNQALDGGAIAGTYDTTVFIEDCVFSQNRALKNGGAVMFMGSSIQLEGCWFQDNYAESGGSVYTIGGRISRTTVVSRSDVPPLFILWRPASRLVFQKSIVVLEKDIIAIQLDGHKGLVTAYDSNIVQGRDGNFKTIRISRRSLSDSPVDTCFIPANSGGFDSKARSCSIPFSYKKGNGQLIPYLTAVPFSEVTPYGYERLGFDRTPSLSWCPMIPIKEYNRRDTAIRSKWGTARCERDCSIQTNNEGWVKEDSHCQFPFDYRETHSKDWIRFDYAPTFLEAKPYGVNLLNLTVNDSTRWCPKIGTKKYTKRDDPSQKLWGVVNCKRDCFIPGGGKGWIKDEMECQLPFRYYNMESKLWDYYDYPPLISEAKPHGTYLLGLDRLGIHRKLRWCPRMGINAYRIDSPDARKSWGIANCGEGVVVPTAAPTPISIYPNCFIEPGNVGWIKKFAGCQFPFKYVDKSGTERSFSYPPRINEAKPYGLAPLGLNPESSERWCPKQGIKVYDIRKSALQRTWSVVSCDNLCNIPAGGTGYMKTYSECQLPFQYLTKQGEWINFDYPPTLYDAKPYGLFALGLTREDKVTRWCPQMGMKMYDFKNESVQTLWGTAKCNPSVEFPTYSPTSSPTASPTLPPTFECTTDGGYATYDSKCKFPFTYEGRTYSKCIRFEVAKPYHGSNQYPKKPLGEITMPLNETRWCSTKTMYDAEKTTSRKRWGYCNAITCGICTTSSGVPCMALRLLNWEEDAEFSLSEHCVFSQQRGSFCFEDTLANRKLLPNTAAMAWASCSRKTCPLKPTRAPSASPTVSPTLDPTKMPSMQPSRTPTQTPTNTPAPTPRPCRTNGGYVSNGSKCRFPFRVDGRWYNKCVAMNSTKPFIGSVDKPRQSNGLGTHWCSTVTRYSTKGSRKSWGFCKNNCDGVTELPTHSPTPSPTKMPSVSPTSLPTAYPSQSPTSLLAPWMIWANYTKLGNLIHVYLDMSVGGSTYQKGWFDCNSILRGLPFDSTGNSLQCMWFRANRMGFIIRSELEYDALRIKRLIVKRGALRNDSFVSKKHGIDVLPPQPSSIIARKTPTLVSQSTVSPDSSQFLTLDASQISNNAHLIDEILYYVQTETGDEEEILLDSCSFFASQTRSSPSFDYFFCKVHLEEILDGADSFFHTRVQIRSVFGEKLSSDWGKVLVVKSLLSPILRVQSNLFVSMRPFESKKFAVSIVNQTHEADVLWGARDSGGKAISEPILFPSTRDNLVAKLQPSGVGIDFQGRRIHVECVVSYKGVNAPPSVYTWTVNILAAQLRAHIKGGNRSIPVGESFLLDGTGSGDSSSSVHDTEPLIYEWQCHPIAICTEFTVNFRAEKSKEERPGSWAYDSNMHSEARGGSHDTVFAASNLPVLTLTPISEKSLRQATEQLDRMVFVLGVKSGDGRVAHSVEEIQVVLMRESTAAGIVGTSQITYWSSLASVTVDNLQVLGYCQESFSSAWWDIRVDYSNTWNALEIGDAYSLGNGAHLYSGPGPTLIQMYAQDPDVRAFTFQLSCGIERGKVASTTSVLVPIHYPPDGGKIIVEPNMGYVDETEFELFTWGWSTEENLPLHFRFEYWIQDLKTMKFSTPLSTSSRFSMMFGPVLPSNVSSSLVYVVGIASDSLGAYKRTEQFGVRLHTKQTQQSVLLARLKGWLVLPNFRNTLNEFATFATFIGSLESLSAASFCGLQVKYLDRLRNWILSTFLDVQDITVLILRVLPLVDFMVARGNIKSLCPNTVYEVSLILRDLVTTWTGFVSHPFLSASNTMQVVSRWPSGQKKSAIKAIKDTLSTIIAKPILPIETECVDKPMMDAWVKELLVTACSKGPSHRGLISSNPFENKDSLISSVFWLELEGLVVTPDHEPIVFDAIQYRCMQWRSSKSDFGTDAKLGAIYQLIKVLLPQDIDAGGTGLMDFRACRYASVSDFGISTNDFVLSEISSVKVNELGGFESPETKIWNKKAFSKSVKRVGHDLLLNTQVVYIGTLGDVSDLSASHLQSLTVSIPNSSNPVNIVCASWDEPSWVQDDCSISIPESGVAFINGEVVLSRVICDCRNLGAAAVLVVESAVAPPNIIPSRANTGHVPLLGTLAVVFVAIAILLFYAVYYDRKDGLIRGHGLLLFATKAVSKRVAMRSGLMSLVQLKLDRSRLSGSSQGKSLVQTGSNGDCSMKSQVKKYHHKRPLGDKFWKVFAEMWRAVKTQHLYVSFFCFYDISVSRKTRAGMISFLVFGNLLLSFVFVDNVNPENIYMWVLVPPTLLLPVYATVRYGLAKIRPHPAYFVMKATKKDEDESLEQQALLQKTIGAYETAKLNLESHCATHSQKHLANWSPENVRDVVIDEERSLLDEDTLFHSDFPGSFDAPSLALSTHTRSCERSTQESADLIQRRLEFEVKQANEEFQKVRASVQSKLFKRKRKMINRRLSAAQRTTTVEFSKISGCVSFYINSGVSGRIEISPRQFFKDMTDPARFSDPSSPNTIRILACNVVCLVILALFIAFTWGFVAASATSITSDSAWQVIYLFLCCVIVDIVVTQPLYVFVLHSVLFAFSPKSSGYTRVEKSSQNDIRQPGPQPTSNNDLSFVCDATDQCERYSSPGSPSASGHLEKLLVQFQGFQEEAGEENTVGSPTQKSEILSQQLDEYSADGNESTASSYAQVPQHLVEEESETFRSAFATLLSEATFAERDNTMTNNTNNTVAKQNYIDVADTNLNGSRDHVVSLSELELESDF